MSKNKPTRQHYVPQVYLKNFCDAKGFIAVMDKDKQKRFSTGPSGVACENDFYTVKRIANPYSWEETYANGIEPLMGKLLHKIMLHDNNLVRNGAAIINDVEKAQLAVIMIMQLLRGKQCREYGAKIYEDTLKDMLENFQEVYMSLSDEQKAVLHSFEDDDRFKEILMDVVLNPEQLKKYATILCGFNFLFYRLRGAGAFITSDNPVMLLSSATANAQPFTNGLLQISTVVYYPISSRLLLCAVRPESLVGMFGGNDCCIVDLDTEKETKFISIVNRKQIEQCSQHAFAQSEDILKKYASNKQISS